MVAIAALCWTHAVAAASLDEILACNAEALGGGSAFESIDTLSIQLDIAEPGFDVRGRYVASRDGRMRIDVSAEGRRVFAEGLDGQRAWQWSPDHGVTESGERGAATLRNGVESPGRFWTLEQLRDRGVSVELVKSAVLARPDEWQLRLTRGDGSMLDYLLDRTSCLPTREVSRRAFHPDVDPTEVPVETTFSEAFTVQGVLRFRRSESRRLDTGEWLGTTVLRDVQQNATLADGIFEAR